MHTDPTPWWRRRWVIITVAVIVVLLVIAGIDNETDNEAAPTPASAATADEPPATLAPTTPIPTDAQAAEIERAVAAIYPGVPSGKATDWARSTCQQLLAGADEAGLLRGVTIRFAGGTRPDPTPDQAAQILDVIRTAGR